MRNILSFLLEKRGIRAIDDLKPSEKAKYDAWMTIFEKETKIDDIKKFLQSEIQRLENEWLDTDNKNPFSYLREWKHNIELKGRINNYKILLAFIDEPERNKVKLEKYLSKLINL